MSPDQELVSAYAKQGSENAFRALVQRHVGLVYATALRQVGDPGLAEEITQNVFVALARKAPRLRGMETLAGWLHRSTILEAKARIRSELRRRQREETAAEFAQLDQEGASPISALIPLLDEALLNLREGDRLALVMRFLEERSLREVGNVLGVDEDAARKRVSRALERLASFFRQRGFTVSAATSGTLLLAGTAKAVPSAVVISSTNAGLAAGGAATGLNLVWYHLAAMTKTQTAVICAVLAATPLAWQWRAEARLQQEQSTISAQLFSIQRTSEQLEQQIESNRQTLLALRTGLQTGEIHLAALKVQLAHRESRPVYRWDDSSPVVRVPKAFLAEVPVSALENKRGKLRGQIRELLQLTDSEAEQTQAAIYSFLADYQSAQAPYVKQVEPTEEDLQGHKPEETRVFEIKSVHEQIDELRQTLFAQLESILGAERFKLFANALEGWLPFSGSRTGMSNHMAVYDFDRRERFYVPKPGDDWMSWSLKEVKGGMIGSTVQIEDIPEFFRPYLQDWIALAQSKPAPQPQPGQ